MEDRYIYPSIFTFEENNQFTVTFPDLPGCITYGNDILEAVENAKEALEGYLYYLEEDSDDIPEPTSILDLKIEPNQACIFIDVWMIPIRDKMKNRSVKKTLTIPKWLDDIASNQNINYSQLLQSTLKEYLGINK